MQHAGTSCRDSLPARHGGGHSLETHQSQVAPPQPSYCMRNTPKHRSMADTRRHQHRSFSQGWRLSKNSPARQDRLRLAAASPALDSSGGDLPPISHNTNATAEGDDDGENNSTQDIESILAKVVPVPDGLFCQSRCKFTLNVQFLLLGRQQLR